MGMTGSGKSYFAGWMLQPNQKNLPRLVVIDSKDDFAPGTVDGARWKLEEWKTAERKLFRGDPVRLRIPPMGVGGYDEYLERLWGIEYPMVLYIEELSADVGPSVKSEALRKIYMMGRTRGIGVIAGAQTPSGLPQFTMTQAEWIVMFRIQGMYDRVPLSYLLGNSEWVPLKGHSFLYKHQTWDSPVYCPGLKVLRADGTPYESIKENDNETKV